MGRLILNFQLRMVTLAIKQQQDMHVAAFKEEERETSGAYGGLEFIDLECHSSINYASGNDNTAWHVSVRKPTPPSAVYI